MECSIIRMLISDKHFKKINTYFFQIVICIIFLSCENQKSKINKLSPPNERPTQKSLMVTLLYSDSSHLKALLKADEMIAYEKNQNEPFVYFPRSIKIIFFNPQQVPTSTLTAQQAVYYTKSQKAYLKYNVNFINDKKEHLITESIIWNRSTGKITTDKPVKIITPHQIINGTGIECEEDFSAYTIKNISGSIQIKDSTNTAQ